MAGDSVADGTRIGELLASELTGLERGPLSEVTVVDADPDAEPSAAGTLAFRVAVGDRRVAAAYLQPDRVRLELGVGPAAAAEAATGPDLRVRPKGGDPPLTLLFVESGAAVKRAVDALIVALDAAESED